MNYRNALNKFIDDMNYLKNEDVEGIIFYGSYHTGTYTEFSDLDLIILYNDDSEINQVKGYKTVDGLPVEYFERTISKIYERANSDYNNCEDSLLSIIGFGEVIFDRRGQVKDLIEYVKAKYSRPLPKYIRHEAVYNAVSLKRCVDSCEELRVQNDPFFENYYFLTVEKIRDFYHRLNGYSNLSLTKVCKLYTNPKLREVQHKTVPEQEFIDIFFDAIQYGLSKEEKIVRIRKLFEYATKDLDIDYDDVRIDIGRKRY